MDWLFVLILILLVCSTLTELDCSETECLNGGSCIRSPGNREVWKCVCAFGYFGELCEKVVTCSERPCLNGGQCVSRSIDTNKAAFKCLCLHGYTGEFCEESQNECVLYPHYCNNGGTCVNINGSAACACQVGFAGSRCEQRFDRCRLKGICINGGKCMDDKCYCRDGFSGERCERVVPRWNEYKQMHCAEHAEFCALRFADGICNGACNDRNCFFDGFDCLNASYSCRAKEYCAQNYANGVCDRECSTAECGFDGGDCYSDTEEAFEEQSIGIVFHAAPHIVVERLPRLLALLAQKLHAPVRTAVSPKKAPRIFALNETLEAQERILLNRTAGNFSDTVKSAKYVLLFVNIDTSGCSRRSADANDITGINIPCFMNASVAVAYLHSALKKDDRSLTLGGLRVKHIYAEVGPLVNVGPLLLAVVVFLVFTAFYTFFACALYWFFEYRISKRLQSSFRDPDWKPGPPEPGKETNQVCETVKNLTPKSLEDGGKDSALVPSSAEKLGGRASSSFSKETLSEAQPAQMPSLVTQLDLQLEEEADSRFLKNEDTASANTEDELTVSANNCTTAAVVGRRDENLLEAIQIGATDLVDLLLLQGANVNIADSEGNTALHHAVTVNSIPIVLALLNTRRCNANAVNSSHQTALTLAVKLPHVSSEIAICLLRYMNYSSGSGPRTSSPFPTPPLPRRYMTVATSYDVQKSTTVGKSSSEVCHNLSIPLPSDDLFCNEALLESKNVAVFDVFGRTALHYAALNNRVNLITVLYANGLKLDSRDKDGCTALYLAAREGHSDLVNILLCLGANKDIADEMNLTPLDIAEQRNHMNVVGLLKIAPTMSNIIARRSIFDTKRNGHSSFHRRTIEIGRTHSSSQSPVESIQYFTPLRLVSLSTISTSSEAEIWMNSISEKSSSECRLSPLVPSSALSEEDEGETTVSHCPPRVLTPSEELLLPEPSLFPFDSVYVDNPGIKMQTDPSEGGADSIKVENVDEVTGEPLFDCTVSERLLRELEEISQDLESVDSDAAEPE